jgi:hypothetical protein
MGAAPKGMREFLLTPSNRYGKSGLFANLDMPADMGAGTDGHWPTCCCRDCAKKPTLSTG